MLDSLTDPLVGHAIESLLGDFQRKGRLDAIDISRIAEKRRLDLDQLHVVLNVLKGQGVVAVEAPTNLEDAEDNHSVSDKSSKYLTGEEERSLANAMRLAARLENQPETPETAQLLRDGKKARSTFITMNLSLVRWMAKRFRNAGLDYDDIVQEGSKGLIRAVDMFDPDLGYRFSTYATWWIRQSISRAVDDHSRTIRIPVHRLESIRKLRRMKKMLEAELGYEPTLPRLASALDWSVEKVALVSDLARFKTIELDAPVSAGSSVSIADSLPDTHTPSPEDNAIREALSAVLDEMLDDLPTDRMKDVIRRRMGIGGAEETLEQIGLTYRVTRERIRQIEAKALKILSNPVRSRKLRTFLD